MEYKWREVHGIFGVAAIVRFFTEINTWLEVQIESYFNLTDVQLLAQSI